MKVLLVNPTRIYRRGGKGIRVGLPIGLMHIASTLEQAGHQVKMFDFLVSKDITLQKLPDASVRYGVTDDKFINFLKQEKPDIIGITCSATTQSLETARVAKMAKSVYPDVEVIAGGPHFSVAGVEFMKENPEVDMAIIGEGEIATRELLDTIKTGRDINEVAGVIFRDNDGQIRTTRMRELIPAAELSLLPLPAYHLEDMPAYFFLLDRGWGPRVRREKGSVSVITSRGCPYNCVFCSVHLHMGQMWRPYTPEYVLNHIDFLVKNYQIKHVSFEDDNLTLDKQRFNKILDGLLERNYGITWDTPNGIRAETLQDEELVRKMKKSGCVELIMGVESGVQETLDKIITKNLKLEHVVKGAEVCKKVGIPLGAAFVIGFPGETKKDIWKTINFALMLRRKYNVNPEVMFATPILGTRLHKICVEGNYLVKELNPETLAVATSPLGWGLIKTKDFTPADLKKAVISLDRSLFRIKLYEALISPRKLVAAIKKKLIMFGVLKSA